jgi:hypothetical protein
LQSFLTIVKYAALFLAAEWLLGRIMPYDWDRACRIVALSRTGSPTLDSNKATLGWVSVIGYTALPQFVVALCAWDLSTRKARTAR